MTNYVVETSLRDSYASVQLSPKLVQQAVDDKVTLLLKELLSAFPEVDVMLTPDSYVQVKAHLMDVLTRKPTRSERKRKMITEQAHTYNGAFKALTISFVYAYQFHLLSFKYAVGDYVNSSSLSPRDEEESYRQFQQAIKTRWDAYASGEAEEFFPSTPASISNTELAAETAKPQANKLLTLASQVVTPKKSHSQLAVETLVASLQKKASRFRSLKLTIEQEYTVDSTMLSCQQIESLISGAQEFSSAEQQETVYEKAIPALTLLDEQFTQLQSDLNAEVIRELGIMEDYLNTKHARLSLTKPEN